MSTCNNDIPKAFEIIHKIGLLRGEQNKILAELVKRKAIDQKAEVTPDEL